MVAIVLGFAFNFDFGFCFDCAFERAFALAPTTAAEEEEDEVRRGRGRECMGRLVSRCGVLGPFMPLVLPPLFAGGSRRRLLVVSASRFRGVVGRSNNRVCPSRTPASRALLPISEYKYLFYIHTITYIYRVVCTWMKQYPPSRPPPLFNNQMPSYPVCINMCACVCRYIE
jgi:hypothetical protein